MTNSSSGENVNTEETKKRAKVRKSGKSAEGKIIQLGETAKVFATVVYFNPTYGRLEGAVYVPEGQYMPDVNGFLAELLKDSYDKGPGHGPQRAQTRREQSRNAQTSGATVRVKSGVGTGSTETGAAAEDGARANTVVAHDDGVGVGINGAGCAGEAAIGHNGSLHAARGVESRTEGRIQLDRRITDDSALRNAGRCAVKQEVSDGAVANVIGRADTVDVVDIGADGVSGTREAGCEVENGRSADVSEWEMLDAQDTRAPAARATRAGLSRTQAAKVQRFLRQISLRMRLVSRQGRLPPYRMAHQDRWRGFPQANHRQ